MMGVTEATDEKSIKSTKDKVATGCGCLFIGLVALGGLGALLPDANKAEAPAAVATATSKVGTPQQSKPAPELKTSLIAQYRAVIEAARPCDQAFKALAKAQSSPLAIYQAAKTGHDACEASTASIMRLDAPEGLPSDVDEAQDKALATCATAYRLRQRGFGAAMEMADNGRAQPSRITAMQEDFQTGQTGVLMCVAELMQTAAKVGVESAAFTS